MDKRKLTRTIFLIIAGILFIYFVLSILRCSIKKYQFPNVIVSDSLYAETFQEIFQIRYDHNELYPLGEWTKFSIEHYLTGVSPDEIVKYIQENQYTVRYSVLNYEEFDAVLVYWNTCDGMFILTIAPANGLEGYSLTQESYTPNDGIIQKLFDCLIPKNPKTCKRF